MARSWRIERGAEYGCGYFVSYTDGDPEFDGALWWPVSYTFTLWGARRVMRRAMQPNVIEQVNG